MMLQPDPSALTSRNREARGPARFVDPETVDAPPGSRQAFQKAVGRDGIAHYVENLGTTETALVEVEDRLLTVVAYTHRRGDAAAFSSMRHFVLYPLEIVTAGRLPGWLRRAIAGAAETFLAALRFDDAVHLNHRIANAEPIPELTRSGWQSLIDLVRARYPRSAIVVQGLRRRFEGETIERVAGCGGTIMPAREISIFDPQVPRPGKAGLSVREQLRKSRKFWRDNLSRCEIDPALSQADLERIAELFRIHSLRHSALNTRYTAGFFGLLNATEGMEVTIWRDEDGKIENFAICDRIGPLPQFMHTAADPRTKMARHALDVAFSRPLGIAMETGVPIGLGAMNVDFKRHRGAELVVEYQVLFADHLPLARRLLWRLLIAYRRWRFERGDGRG